MHDSSSICNFLCKSRSEPSFSCIQRKLVLVTGGSSNLVERFYRSTFFVIEEGWTLDRNTDDWAQRTNIYTIAAGSLNASSTSNPNIKTVWSYTYKNISRANRILEALDKLEGKYSTTELNTLRAEARFSERLLIHV